MEDCPEGTGQKPESARRATLDELDDFLCGKADEETRRRIGSELLDPTSRLRQFVEGVRTLAEDLTGWRGTNDDRSDP